MLVGLAVGDCFLKEKRNGCLGVFTVKSHHDLFFLLSLKETDPHTKLVLFPHLLYQHKDMFFKFISRKKII